MYQDEKIKQICDKIYYMATKRKSFVQICKDLELKDYEVAGLITMMHQQGYNIEKGCKNISFFF